MAIHQIRAHRSSVACCGSLTAEMALVLPRLHLHLFQCGFSSSYKETESIFSWLRAGLATLSASSYGGSECVWCRGLKNIWALLLSLLSPWFHNGNKPLLWARGHMELRQDIFAEAILYQPAARHFINLPIADPWASPAGTGWPWLSSAELPTQAND